MIDRDLPPELEAHLADEAAAHGRALGRYAEDIVTHPSLENDADIFYSSEQQLTEQQLAANLSEGLADIAEGRTRPAREVFAELHRQYGIDG